MLGRVLGIVRRSERSLHGALARLPGGDRLVSGLGLAAKVPIELTLRSAIRRLARRRPDVFERLGAAGDARILICPTGYPFAFLLQPSGRDGSVRIVDANPKPTCDARIEAPLDLLLRLLEGREDGDAALFASELWIEGDTGIVLGLRNAVEAAEVRLGDLLPLPPGLHALSARLGYTTPAVPS